MINRELDKWIAENIMGWKVIELCLDYYDIYDSEEGFSIHNQSTWHPTESISDAFQVVEKNINNPKLQFSGLQLIKGQEGYFWECKYYNGQMMHSGRDKTAPLAICIAVKKAIELR